MCEAAQTMPQGGPTLAGFAQAMVKAIGPTQGYHIAKCDDGGYLVIVDGKPRAARTMLHEAVAVMGRLAANQFGESAVPPEQARDVSPRPDVRDEPTPDGPPRVFRPPLRPVLPPEVPTTSVAERMQATAVLVLAMLTVGMRGLVGV